MIVFPGSTRDRNFSMEEPVFFSHERNMASALVHAVSLGSYHIPIR